MKRFYVLMVLALSVGFLEAIPSQAADYVTGIEGPPYPLPEACVVSLEQPVSFADNEAEWVRYESSLWLRMGSRMYLPEFYEKSEAPPGYVNLRMYWPDKWDAELELVVACGQVAEPADVAGLIGDAIAIIATGHNGFSAFADEYGFDDTWFERSLAGAIQALHPLGQHSRPFQVEFILLDYDIGWCDHQGRWQSTGD